MDIQGILLGHVRMYVCMYVRMYVRMLILHVLKISAYALLSDLTKAYLCSLVTAVHTSGRILSLADCSIPARRHIHTCVQSEERIQGKEIVQMMIHCICLCAIYNLCVCVHICMHLRTYSDNATTN